MVTEMVAVAHQRERLKQLTVGYVDKVATFLQQQFGEIADSTMAALQSCTGTDLDSIFGPSKRRTHALYTAYRSALNGFFLPFLTDWWVK
jgi:hypothetical protein